MWSSNISSVDHSTQILLAGASRWHYDYDWILARRGPFKCFRLDPVCYYDFS